jgi:nitrite reductase/ring-hydroxylating ferredoxin subunit
MMEGGSKPTRRPRPLKKPYAAYDSPRDLAPEEVFARVGRGTPCGEYFRRFWQPVCLSSHLTDLPKRLRILGEDLVAFRDKSGCVGVLELHCSHRGTSLEFGKIEDRGIRCCYHGWQFDVDGTILDTPGEPEGSPIKDRICHGAYPAFEWHGLVFAYMGPPEEKPEFPLYDAFEREGVEYLHRYRQSPCNWLQVRENEMDPIHLSFLHTRLFGVQFQPVYGEIPTMEWVETDIGMAYLTVRRWKDWLYLRVNDMILPNIVRVAGIEDAEGETVFDRRGAALNWVVPVDDTNTLNIGFGDIDKNLTLEGRQSYTDRVQKAGGYTVGAGDVGQTGEPSYEQRQRAPGDWDAWTSQGAVSIHAREHLGYTDQGVALYRKLVKDGIAAVQAGKAPKGVLKKKAAKPILTYCHNTVKKVARASTEQDDRKLATEFGREIFRQINTGKLAKKNVGAEYPADFIFPAKR